MAHRNVTPMPTDAGSIVPPANGTSALKDIADAARAQNISYNEYKNIDDNRYGSTHPNAQSDGDEHGKGETQQGIGSSDDIQKRFESIIQQGNRYNYNNGYNGIQTNVSPSPF